jgi:hypothetical protein
LSTISKSGGKHTTRRLAKRATRGDDMRSKTKNFAATNAARSIACCLKKEANAARTSRHKAQAVKIKCGNCGHQQSNHGAVIGMDRRDYGRNRFSAIAR